LFLEILSARDASAPSLRPDPREEVRLLLGLLREAVAAVPGIREPGSDHALARVAAELSTAS
jgi:hypothetical protein